MMQKKKTPLMCTLSCALLACLVAAFVLATVPQVCEGSGIYGGECKRACRNTADCDEDEACDGNCTGADEGALCGEKSNYANSWGCSKEESLTYGGCNLSVLTATAITSKQCKCDANETCVLGSTAGPDCKVNTVCATDSP